nr:stage V sporulation T C-terminal domain-containing protein [uncultured Agathobaculum sp.]
MKATGIVRRIDDLGRVVIPKEIRRTLRIREGDPLEIFTDRDGEVIFKKYSPMGELGAIASELAEALARTAGMSCAICDRDAVIAAAGGAKKDILEKSISSDLEQIMEQRITYERGVGDAQEITVSDRDAYDVIVAAPIITDGDVTGCVVFVSEDENAAASDVTVKLCQTAAQFLSRRVAV